MFWLLCLKWYYNLHSTCVYHFYFIYMTGNLKKMKIENEKLCILQMYISYN